MHPLNNSTHSLTEALWGGCCSVPRGPLNPPNPLELHQEKVNGRGEGNPGGQGLLALLLELTVFAADEIQMDLQLSSALFPLPSTAGAFLFSRNKKIPWQRKRVFPCTQKELFIC